MQLIFSIGCKKSTSSGGGTTPATSNKDIDNFNTIDGVTNYHYSYPAWPAPTVSCSNTLNLFMWDNKNNNEPDFSSKAYIQSTLVLGDTAETITVYHKNNGVISTYYLTSFNKSVYKKNTLNGVTSEEIKNLKMYKNISDTTGPFKYVSAKWTCNGK